MRGTQAPNVLPAITPPASPVTHVTHVTHAHPPFLVIPAPERESVPRGLQRLPHPATVIPAPCRGYLDVTSTQPVPSPTLAPSDPSPQT